MSVKYTVTVITRPIINSQDRTPRKEHFDLPGEYAVFFSVVLTCRLALDEARDRAGPVSGTSLLLAEGEPDSPIHPEPVGGTDHQTAEDRPIAEDPGIKLFKNLRNQPDPIAKWLSELGIVSTVTIRRSTDSGVGTVKKRAGVTIETTLPSGKTKAAQSVRL